MSIRERGRRGQRTQLRSQQFVVGRLIVAPNFSCARRCPTHNHETHIMAFKVQVGPPQIAIHQGQTVLVSEPDGQINWPSDKGLYFLDTRIISSWADLRERRTVGAAERGPRQLLRGTYLSHQQVHPDRGRDDLPRTLGLTISRSISGGLHEDLDITNNSMKPVRFQLEVAFRCDFADIFEVKSGHIVRRGQITTEWSEAPATGSAPPIRTRIFIVP